VTLSVGEYPEFGAFGTGDGEVDSHEETLIRLKLTWLWVPPPGRSPSAVKI